MTLSRREHRWAEVVGRTLIPQGVCGGVLDAVSAGERLDHEVVTSAWYLSLLLRFGLLMVWLSPAFIIGRFSTLGGLPEVDRTRVLEALLSHRSYTLRMIAAVMKITFCTVIIGERSLLVRLNAYGLAEAHLPLNPPPEPVRVLR